MTLSTFRKLTGSSLCLALLGLTPPPAHAVELADAPMTVVNVPGNLILALSVEFPTATTPAYSIAKNYSADNAYLGYFDPGKCYVYLYDAASPENSYFQPHSLTSTRTCGSNAANLLWSGNYLNWAAMQTLDTFRWVLTGGYRSKDTAEETILTKTLAVNDSGYNPDKSVPRSVANAATPFNGVWTKAWTQVRTRGAAIYIGGEGVSNDNQNMNSFGAVVDYDGQNYFVPVGDPKRANNSTAYKIYINVKVCDSAVGLEANCKQYGDHYKPEGLMQKYSQRLRYSAFGYYNDNRQQRDGGVMRARMKFIGPTQPTSTPLNPNAEWDAATGIMTINPDAADAKATVDFAKSQGKTVTVPNSGVMNYLNKFGYYSRAYKTNDPVSELYYAATRYLRHLGNVSAYTSLDGANDNTDIGDTNSAQRWLDGFPAITEWDDPVIACQQNFILGIGDVYSHYDGNLPGSTVAQGGIPSPVPSADIALDKTVDVTKANSAISKLEGPSVNGGNVSDLGAYLDGDFKTFYIAGLAYDAHTKDIRPDQPGKQTINTYWLDVLEGNSEGPKYVSKNQYYLAAKYGGFKVPEGFDPYAASNVTTSIADDSWWTTNDKIVEHGEIVQGGVAGDKRPDNYFPGGAPETMKAGLEAAFEKITSESAASSTTLLSGTTAYHQSSGNANYSISYDPATWTSTLLGQLLDYHEDGLASPTTVWDATSLLDGRPAANRHIVTWNEGGTPFAQANLSSAQTKALGDDVAGIIGYLRGDRSLENGVYRKRAHLLGDVVNSKLLAVGAPSQVFRDTFNPGYGKFQHDQANRPTIVYVGANDGMLHAFDGSVPATAAVGCASPLVGSYCGKELFAYIPGLIYGDADTGPVSGLASLAKPNFVHHYLVDGNPVVGDVDFKNTQGAATEQNDWRSILVGGLGKGGKGYYAIDVTRPSEWTSETAVAAKVLWEFSDEKMGYSYGDPVIVKTPQFGWTVIVASGYNNGDGKAYLFLLNPRNGDLLKTVSLPEGAADFAQITAYTQDYRDLTADAIYGGDLHGNLWRIDLTVSKSNADDEEQISYHYPVTKIAELTAPDGTPQPVTIRPLVEVDPASGKRYVLIGTGQLLSSQDAHSSQIQTFYAIADGVARAGKFAAFASPITRADLNENANLLDGIGSSPALDGGWYFDLATDETSHIAERIDVPMAATNTGVVGFAANLPNDDPCTPGGTSRVFALNFALGRTVLLGADGGLIVSSFINASVTDIVFSDVGGTPRLDVGDSRGKLTSPPGGFSGVGGYKRLNWREVPSAN